MKKHKLTNLFVLSLLFALGIIYGAQVYFSCSKQSVVTVAADLNDDTTERSEENVKESSYLFLHEKLLYHLKPFTAPATSLKVYIAVTLPEAYLSLSTPPPDFA